MNHPIHTSSNTPHRLLATACAAFVAASTFAQVPSPPPSEPATTGGSPGTTGLAQPPTTSVTTAPVAAPTTNTGAEPSHAEMMQMMEEMAKLNENHKLLAEMVGTWNYTVKMWMDPSAPPTESKGTATRKAEMGGRYFVMDASGKFAMPGPDGKMQQFDFKGRATEGYDNAKKKFVSSWIDNMGTGIMLSEGTYDPATKTFTFHANYDMAPGVQTKIRETLKITDKDHHTMEWFEQRGGQEVKTMEIAYTRKK
jgi:hypothetical protein